MPFETADAKDAPQTEEKQITLPTGDYLTQEEGVRNKPTMVMPNGEQLVLADDYWSLNKKDGSLIITEKEAAKLLDHKNAEMILENGAKLRCEGITWNLDYPNGDEIVICPLKMSAKPIVLKDGTGRVPEQFYWVDNEVIVSRNNGKDQAKFLATGPEVLIAFPLKLGT